LDHLSNIIIFGETDSFNYDCNDLSPEEIKGFITESLSYYIKCVKEAINNDYNAWTISKPKPCDFKIQQYNYYKLSDNTLGASNTIVEAILNHITDENKALLEYILSKYNLTVEWVEWEE